MQLTRSRARRRGDDGWGTWRSPQKVFDAGISLGQRFAQAACGVIACLAVLIALALCQVDAGLFVLLALALH